MIVYFHRNPITKTVFYVGIGASEKRAYSFYKSSRSSFWHKIVLKYGKPIVDIIHINLTKEDACSLEIQYIKEFGFIKDGGTLCNLSYGGELSPMKNKDVAERVHSQLIGRSRPDMYGERNPSKKPENRLISRSLMHKLIQNKTPEQIEKQRESARLLFTNRNPMFNQKTKWKILEHQRKRVIQMDKTGNEIMGHISINDAGRFIGKSGSKVYMCCSGQRKSAYGYLWKYAA